jgi:hypothetical protein
MTFEQAWLLFLMVPTVSWMIRDSYRSCNANPLVINLFVTLMLLALCLTGFEFRASSPASGCSPGPWPAYRKRISGMDARVKTAHRS